MKLFSLMLALALTSQARVSDKDFVDGKVIQSVDLGNGSCGQEGFIILQTKNTFRFIYEYRRFDQRYYQRYVGFQVRVVYRESVGELTDCTAGIIDLTVKEIK